MNLVDFRRNSVVTLSGVELVEALELLPALTSERHISKSALELLTHWINDLGNVCNENNKFVLC